MVRHAALVIAALVALITFSAPASAGFALARPPAGWVKTQAGATFKAPHTFPGNDGYFRTTAAVNVGGRMIDFPAGLKVAANAAQFVAPALAAIPGVGLGPATLAWLAAAGISWGVNEWMVSQMQTVRTVGEWTAVTEAEGLALYQSVTGHAGYVHSGSWHEPGQVTMCRLSNPGNHCWFWTKGATTIEEIPATEQTWQQITGELPNAVAEELAARMPLPVELPESLPLRVPVGSPEPVPATNPQRYKQQVVDIVPRPSTAEPWRVELKPGEIESEDENMGIDPEPLDGESSEAEPTAGDEPKPGLCEEYPDILACQRLDEIQPEPIPDKQVPMSINPETGFGEGTGSCPADKQFSVMGQSLAMSWQPVCDFATGIRPVIIALAWLSAALAFLGIARKE